MWRFELNELIWLGTGTSVTWCMRGGALNLGFMKTYKYKTKIFCGWKAALFCLKLHFFTFLPTWPKVILIKENITIILVLSCQVPAAVRGNFECCIHFDSVSLHKQMVCVSCLLYVRHIGSSVVIYWIYYTVIWVYSVCLFSVQNKNCFLYKLYWWKGLQKNALKWTDMSIPAILFPIHIPGHGSCLCYEGDNTWKETWP